MSVQSTRATPNGAKPKEKKVTPIAEIKPKPKPAKVPTLKIIRQPKKSYREGSARALYWERFQQYDGKPLADLEKSCGAKPPSVPTKVGGRLTGKQEPFGGWLSFFKQQELVEIV